MKVLSIAIAITVSVFGVCASTPQLPRPNFLVVMIDDLADSTYDAARAFDYVPNIEALRARAHEFPNHISPTPLCCPARANFFTGQIAQTNSVWNNVRGHLMDDSDTIATRLQSAGYETAIVGKYLNRVGDSSSSSVFHQRAYVAPGWSHWHVLIAGSPLMYDFEFNEDGIIKYYGTTYQTDLVSSRAEGFISQMPEPFFMYVASTAVHGEAGIKALGCDSGVRTDWKIRPAPRHEDTPFVAAPRSPSYNEPDISDKPWNLPKLKRHERQCIDDLFSSRVAALRSLDDLVGAVIAASPENTVVLIVSDQGYLFGEHRFTSKAVPYEESIRTRAYLAMPGESANVKHDALVSMIDWAPTILDVAGISSDGMDGSSLTCIINGTCQNVRSRLRLYQLDQDNKMGGTISFTGWRTGSNDPQFPNSVWWAWTPSGAKEGYDLTTDPYQLNNVR